MKKQLTQTDVNNYVYKEFCKSRFSPTKVIKINSGTYMSPYQAATLISFHFKSENYGFSKNEMTAKLIECFKHIKTPTKEQIEKLSKLWPEWNFFEEQFEEEKTYKARALYKSFCAKLAVNGNAYKYFYTQLRRWGKENGHYINIRNRLANRIIMVVKNKIRY